MKNRLNKLLKNEKGQAVVELALLLPILILIICGIVELGWLFTNQLMLNNVSREGARYGVVYSLDTNQLNNIKTKVQSLLPNYAKTSVNINVSYSNTITPRAGDVIVNLSYQVVPLTPVTDIFASSGVLLKSKCVMKLE